MKKLTILAVAIVLTAVFVSCSLLMPKPNLEGRWEFAGKPGDMLWDSFELFHGEIVAWVGITPRGGSYEVRDYEDIDIWWSDTHTHEVWRYKMKNSNTIDLGDGAIYKRVETY